MISIALEKAICIVSTTYISHFYLKSILLRNTDEVNHIWLVQRLTSNFSEWSESRLRRLSFFAQRNKSDDHFLMSSGCVHEFDIVLNEDVERTSVAVACSQCLGYKTRFVRYECGR